MGVPRLFSYLRRRYPSILETKASTVSSIYLDGNALLYPIAELGYKSAESIAAILLEVGKGYRDAYGCPIHLYMDGAAHMAKIRQQRFRRFQANPITLVPNVSPVIGEKDQPIPLIPWTSVMFSPGTIMMDQIHQVIESGWTFGTYSSYLEPGEGEHKIIRDIRSSASEGTIGIVGKDADLLMLGMGLQEEGYTIVILRHNDLVSEHGNPNGFRHDDPIFVINCGDLRKAILAGWTNGIHSIWDFNLAVLLVGNDFLPPVPEFEDIRDALPLIESVSPTLYRNNTIDWNGVMKLITDMLKYSYSYGRWLPGYGRKALNPEAFRNLYLFRIYPWKADDDFQRHCVQSWAMTVQWVFQYYHDGLDHASIAWQYPLSFSPSLWMLHEYPLAFEDTMIDPQYPKLTPVQALAAMLPIWLQTLIPDPSITAKLVSISEYYPYAFVLDGPRQDPLIPTIPYDIVASL